MKNLAILPLMALIAFLTASAQAAPAPPTLADQVAAIVQPQLDQHPDLDLGVAVGIVQPGSAGAILNHIFYFGKLVDRNRSPLTLDGATEFEIGSVSKTFTTTILAALIQNDPSILDLSTNSIFPQTPTFMGGQTTIRDLADYTSGLPDSNRDGGSSTCRFNGGPINNCYALSLMFDHLEPGPQRAAIRPRHTIPLLGPRGRAAGVCGTGACRAGKEQPRPAAS
jgi:CubicO group peptidase (beta-lactamase class C family)